MLAMANNSRMHAYFAMARWFYACYARSRLLNSRQLSLRYYASLSLYSLLYRDTLFYLADEDKSYQVLRLVEHEIYVQYYLIKRKVYLQSTVFR